MLQLLAGYDLVEVIRDALPSWMVRYRRRCYPDMLPKPDDEYLGPFCHSPIMLELEPNGQLYLRLVDVDGPDESDILYHDDGDAQRAIDDFAQAPDERARSYAEEVLPLLTKAGFGLSSAR